MIRLSTLTLVQLRDRLHERGIRPSRSDAMGPPSARLAAEISEAYGPLCDAMYVMMGCDGEITSAERDVIRGALRELDPRIHAVHVEGMLAAAQKRLGAEGRAGCIRDIGRALADDPARSEAAFMLAAAVGYADDRLVQVEKEVLNQLAAALGIPPARAGELFDSLETVEEIPVDPSVDAGDLLLRIAMRLNAPEDFERLAATSPRSDVTLLLRLYASFVRSGEEARERSAASGSGRTNDGTPRSLSAARVAALHAFADGLARAGTSVSTATATTLARLAQALDLADKTSGLRPLVTPVEGPSPMATLESALDALAQLAYGARMRAKDGRDRTGEIPASMGAHSLARVVHAVVEDRSKRGELAPAISASIRRAEQIVPRSIAETIALVLERLIELPVERPSLSPGAHGVPELPEWLPSKRTLGGFYVLSQLGAGGTATVFVVTRSDERDEPNAERFALKVPIYDVTAARQISEAEYLRMFRAEAGALLALPDHPNLCRFISFDAAARPKPVLVMELVEGHNCEKVIASGQMTVARAFAILDGVLSGLEAMHGVGIAHLDLKPSNVVLRSRGDAALVDFGLAGRQLRPGCGTVCYAAPEVWGVAPEGASLPTAADLYAFACVAYELLTGKTLFEGQDETAVVSAHVMHDGRPEGIARIANRAETGHLAAILSHCLRRDPRDRPKVGAIRGALRNVAGPLARYPWPLPV